MKISKKIKFVIIFVSAVVFTAAVLVTTKKIIAAKTLSDTTYTVKSEKQ